MSLYFYYLEGYLKTMSRKLPDFAGYPTVQAFCYGALDKMHGRPKMTKPKFELYLMLR